ncbi:Na(+)/H(+) antiporter subunit C [Microbacterium helvum]|uniref:Na(+)/H(+) antiporter subunit C n=1 Tax=Microbacterium helvum TaxID=2773713 RepID=UPI002964B995|nr:Na(+)/H(+) antiporter subunit C [Microbacterium helvum]
MNVSLILIIVMAVLFACGVYAMLERSLTRVLIGFLLLGNATNLLLLIVMGAPGVAPFFGAAEDVEDMSDPLPQALTLTAIVITFAVSAFLLALIYRSWQLGQADTVTDDEADLEVRERGALAEDAIDEEIEIEDADDETTTDFVGTATAPITILGARDFAGLRDDAPVDRPEQGGGVDASTRGDRDARRTGIQTDDERGSTDDHRNGGDA